MADQLFCTFVKFFGCNGVVLCTLDFVCFPTIRVVSSYSPNKKMRFKLYSQKNVINHLSSEVNKPGYFPHHFNSILKSTVFAGIFYCRIGHIFHIKQDINLVLFAEINKYFEFLSVLDRIIVSYSIRKSLKIKNAELANETFTSKTRTFKFSRNKTSLSKTHLIEERNHVSSRSGMDWVAQSRAMN